MIQIPRNRYILAGVLTGYALIALYGPHLGRTEAYPFFNWSLFSASTPIRSEVVFLVKSINGRDYPEPVLYSNLKPEDGFTPSRNIRVLKIAHQFKVAQEVSRERADKVLDMIKETYFRGVSSAEFDIVVIEYNPIARLRAGQYEVRQVLRQVTL